MKNSTKYSMYLVLGLAGYFSASKYIFEEVNKNVVYIVDELFHIPQGLACCKGNCTDLDPKITTLPGLYLLSAAIINATDYLSCNAYHLRLVNVVASCVNFLLIASIIKYVYGNNENQFKIVLQSFNLAILPPLYFFSHLYYTDTISVMFILIFSRLCFTHKHNFMIFFFGLCCVMMRQTNIVWIAMVLGHKLTDLFIKSSRVYGNNHLTKYVSKHSIIAHDIDTSKLKRYYSFSDLIAAIRYHLNSLFLTFLKFISLNEWTKLLPHISVLIGFVVFWYSNGSIVIGDKQAHTPTIHITQLFYFLLFYGVFGLPYVLSKLKPTLKLIYNHKTIVILLSGLFLVVVHFNTITHPYLLADNRHYTFYIWNRWYGKYEMAKYVTVPAYVFLLFSLYVNLKDQNCVSFLLPYSVSTCLVLALQRMIEVRYFIVPYLILRLRFSRPSFKVVFAEFLWYLLINFATYYVFFTKEIMWKDFDYVQRIIW